MEIFHRFASPVTDWMSSELPLLLLGAASPRTPLDAPPATGPAWPTKTNRCSFLHRAHLRHRRRRPTYTPLLHRARERGEALTLEEASKHNTKDNCWLIIVGKALGGGVLPSSPAPWQLILFL